MNMEYNKDDQYLPNIPKLCKNVLKSSMKVWGQTDKPNTKNRK